jgi:hypothetical protein
MSSTSQSLKRPKVLSNCVHFNDPQCQSSVAVLLDPNQIGLQSRTTGVLLWLGAWIFGLIAAALTMVFSKGLGPQANGNFHIPQTDIAQIQSATSASILIFATATDDTNSMSVTAAPAPFEYVDP